VLAEGKVSATDLEMFSVTDSAQEAVETMVQAQLRRASPSPGAGESPGDAQQPE
jgi:hypothetical protein